MENLYGDQPGVTASAWDVINRDAGDVRAAGLPAALRALIEDEMSIRFNAYWRSKSRDFSSWRRTYDDYCAGRRDALQLLQCLLGTGEPWPLAERVKQLKRSDNRLKTRFFLETLQVALERGVR